MNICSYKALSSITDLSGINDRFSSVYKQVCYLLSITGTGSTGAGTINAGTINRLTYYAANGTTVSPLAAISASRALASDINGLPVASSVTSTELGYVSGVTSAIQTQLTGKQNTITTGTTAQYFRGDLSLATFPTTLPLSSLSAATAINSINNGDFTQTWNWDGSLGFAGLSLSSNTTTASNSSHLLNVAVNGAHTTGGLTSYAANFTNSHSGTNSTNIALALTAISGTNNYALITTGSVGINNSTPTAYLHISGGTAIAGTAPIKLTSGTALTTPENGAIEYHGSHLYFTIGSTRYQLDQQGGGVSSAFGRTGAVVATSGDYTVAQVTGAAPLASPTFTGTPLAPTATTGTNTTQVATTAFVQQELTASTSYFGPMFSGAGTSGDPIIPIAAYNNQTGTTYTLVAADNGKVVTLSNSSAITLTVPVSLPTGFNCSIVQLGAGQVTITASSTTIHNRQSFTKTAGQYSAVTILQYATNTFLTQGDMA